MIRCLSIVLSLLLTASAIAAPAVTPPSADFTATKAASVTQPMIQAAINALPSDDGVPQAASPDGGAIRLPVGKIDLGVTPIYLPSGCELSGVSRMATQIKYSGTGAAIRLSSVRGNYHQLSAVHDLSIYSTGDGIAFDAASTNATEAGRINLSALVFNVAGTAIDLHKPDGRAAYFPRIQNISIDFCGGHAIRFDGVGALIDSVFICNRYGTLPTNRPSEMFDLQGNGVVSNCQIESDNDRWQTVAITAIGSWDFVGNWIEWGHDPQIVLQNDNGNQWPTVCTIDRAFFVYPTQRIKLIGKVDLKFTRDGQHDWDATKISNYFQNDDGLARVFVGEKQILP